MTTDEKMAGKLDRRIALVTGGTSGIGLATAKRFVAEGAYVFITGRREKELASAVKSIGESLMFGAPPQDHDGYVFNRMVLVCVAAGLGFDGTEDRAVRSSAHL
jgi:NAD(P)-dependent dehydrogenase (short-subunit alcohol dehydrogenase family)